MLLPPQMGLVRPPPPHPLENSGFASYFPLKDLAFKTPTLGMDIFWNHSFAKTGFVCFIFTKHFNSQPFKL